MDKSQDPYKVEGFLHPPYEGGQAASHHLLQPHMLYGSLTWFTAASHGLLEPP